jgi:hypothetical protein
MIGQLLEDRTKTNWVGILREIKIDIQKSKSHEKTKWGPKTCFSCRKLNGLLPAELVLFLLGGLFYHYYIFLRVTRYVLVKKGNERNKVTIIFF